MSAQFWHTVEAWASQPELLALAGALMHFLWQGAVIALLLAAALTAIRGRSSNLRYLTAYAALLAMAGCPIATFAWLSRSVPSTGVDVSGATAPHAQMHLITADRTESRTGTESAPVRVEGSAATPTERPVPSSSIHFDLVNVLRPFAPWMVAIWLTGVVALSVRLCIGWVEVQQMRRRGVRPVPAEWEERLARIAERLRVSRPVRMVESALIEAPTVIGWLRPLVLVPASAWVGLSPAQLEALLAHELAHVQRHDYAVNFLQTVLETLLFYHPAVWWVSRTIRREREACCDDIAVAICGDRCEYARALASMEELRARGYGLALAANGGQLLYRIRRIVGVPAPQSNVSGWWLMAAVAASVLAVVAIAGPGGARAEADDDKPKQTADKQKPATDDQTPAADDDGWGPASNGLRCRVTPVAADVDDASPDLKKKVETYARGDDLTLAIELKNVGDKTITLMEAEGNKPFVAPHLFEIEYTDKDGKPIPRAERQFLTNILILIESSTHEVKAGQTHVTVLRPAKFNPPLNFSPPPGEYQVRIRYHVGQKSVEEIAKHWPDKAQAKAWTGSVTAKPAAFTVAKSPAAKPVELRWGETKDGLRAAVEFRDNGKSLPSDGSQVIPLNTKLDVVFHFQNVGDKTIHIVSETWRQGDSVTAKDEAGEEQTLKGAWYTGLPIMARWTIKPQETAEIQAISLGIAANQEAAGKFEHPVGPTLIAKPGKYRFRYTIHLNSVQTRDKEGNPLPGEGDRTDVLTTGETTVSVRARTPEDEAAERAGHFTGQIAFVGKGGRAVESGEVWVRTIGQREAPRPIKLQAGPVKVPDVSSKPVTVSVVAPGYEEMYFQGVVLTPDETRRFELKPAVPARFRLVAYGKPVAGAKVRHFDKTSDKASSGPYPMHGVEGPIQAVSAQDGTVVLDSLQKVNQGYEDLGAAVYFCYIEAPPGLVGRFLGPIRAGEDLGDVEMSQPLEVRGEIRGTPEELKNFAAEWDQPFEMKTANPDATWSYAVSQRLETNREGDRLTFHLKGLRPGKLRIISNFMKPPHSVSHSYTRRDPGKDDVVVEVDVKKSLDDLVITPKGRKAVD